MLNVQMISAFLFNLYYMYEFICILKEYIPVVYLSFDKYRFYSFAEMYSCIYLLKNLLCLEPS